MPRLLVDGLDVTVPEGATVLAAMGQPPVTRVSVGGMTRGPLCGMGQCFECRVLVDGRETLACLTPATEGMVVRRG